MATDLHPAQIVESLHTNEARILKAIRLADALDAAGLGSAEVPLMGPREWLMLAAAAQTRVPSERTRELVSMFLHNRETARATFAATSRV